MSPNTVLEFSNGEEVYFMKMLPNLWEEHVIDCDQISAFFSRQLCSSEIVPLSEEDFEEHDVYNLKSNLMEVLSNCKALHLSKMISKIANESYEEIRQYIWKKNKAGKPKKKRRKLNNIQDDYDDDDDNDDILMPP